MLSTTAQLGVDVSRTQDEQQAPIRTVHLGVIDKIHLKLEKRRRNEGFVQLNAILVESRA
jgi:hypothetical protein